MKRLAIITTHPIQYNSPVFKLLAASEGIELKVFYTWEQSASGKKFDPGFGREIEWDIPLLEGFEYEFVGNTAREPGSHHFSGIVNPDLIALVSAWRPDLLLVYGWSFDSHLKALRHFKGRIPVLFRGDSTLIDEMPGVKRAIRRIFLKWVYGYVDYALYTGTHNKAYFSKHGLGEDRLIFAPHAIDNERFEGSEGQYREEAAAWRHQLGFAGEDLVVLFAAKLETKKNPFFLFELAREITDPRLKFLVAGNGHLEKELREKAGGDQRFVFLDFQNQLRMPLVYRLGDVFILPSLGPGETWGLSVNEAMACGLPVIVSEKVGCAIDLVKTGENGLIIKGNEAAGPVKFLRDSLNDADRLPAMGGRSQALIQPYNNRRFVEAIHEIIYKTENP